MDVGDGVGSVLYNRLNVVLYCINILVDHFGLLVAGGTW